MDLFIIPLNSFFDGCLGFISIWKTNIKGASATVHRPGSPSLLFLHIPDIIIAVRSIIICLLWKLADCLSPVPEELPIVGVLLEKHHRSGLSHAEVY